LCGHGLLGRNVVRGHLNGECDLEEQARATQQERGRRAEAPSEGGRRGREAEFHLRDVCATTVATADSCWWTGCWSSGTWTRSLTLKSWRSSSSDLERRRRLLLLVRRAGSPSPYSLWRHACELQVCGPSSPSSLRAAPPATVRG
jgi:hypothetical protein